ncbi:MAG: rhodanese-related sulfurtransferase [Rickettsiales bacterium]|jgi:rhodanese-related sulfurtransferase
MNIKSIDCATLNSWIENEEVVLVDVREIYENETVRIDNSTLIPVGNVDEDKLPELNGGKLVIYCRSGVRSVTACEKLLVQNPDLEIYNLKGGIIAWINCGFKILSDDKNSNL